eukprot:15461577-Alexandrium_andersonii.AAC.1
MSALRPSPSSGLLLHQKFPHKSNRLRRHSCALRIDLCPTSLPRLGRRRRRRISPSSATRLPAIPRKSFPA